MAKPAHGSLPLIVYIAVSVGYNQNDNISNQAYNRMKAVMQECNNAIQDEAVFATERSQCGLQVLNKTKILCRVLASIVALDKNFQVDLTKGDTHLATVEEIASKYGYNDWQMALTSALKMIMSGHRASTIQFAASVYDD